MMRNLFWHSFEDIKQQKTPELRTDKDLDILSLALLFVINLIFKLNRNLFLNNGQ